MITRISFKRFSKEIFIPLLLLLNMISLQGQLPPQDTSDGKTVIREMFSKYAGKWYSNLTFEQKTTFYQNGILSREETWHEAMQMPTGLVIKTGTMEDGNGFMFKSDSMFIYKDGNLVRKMPRVHDLLVLGFSVYFESPENTIKKLSGVGLDFSYLKIEGNQYLIGNPAQKQVWIETDRLLFTKLRVVNPDGSISITEFNKYIKLGDAWIAPEVLFYHDEVLTMKEEYYDISISKQMPSTLFDGNDFKSLVW